jgi:hypothetical protein
MDDTIYYCDGCNREFTEEPPTEDGYTYLCKKCRENEKNTKKCLRCAKEIFEGEFCDDCELYSQN